MGNECPRATIGCDPEFFLIDSNGNLISAIGIVPGTKEEPHGLPSGGGLQVDNVALEFSTPVAKDGQDMVNILFTTLNEVRASLPGEYKFVARPSAIFADEQLLHPEAQRFGCDPDFDAWLLQINEKPSHDNPAFRSCGGHIHVGHVDGDGNDFLLEPFGKVEVVKTMDTLHGIVSTILDCSAESIERRKLYGGAGCHRPTEYGVEYRVLSNFWIKGPMLVMLMDSLTQDALKLIREGKSGELIEAIGQDLIVDTINGGRKAQAEEIFHTYLEPILSDDSKFYFNECVKTELSDDVHQNWQTLYAVAGGEE